MKKKYKHKKTGLIINEFTDGHYISNDIKGFILHRDSVENSSDWEEIEKLIHPIGTKFKTHIGETIFTLESFKNEEVIISYPDESGYGFTGYPIKYINEFFTDGTWIKVDENNSYEILSFTDMQNTIYYKSKINDLYQSSEYKISLSEHYAKSNLLINSIKRLSDGEVFTLGDTLNEYDCVITEFHITTDGTLKIFSDSKTANKHIFDGVEWSLENAEKAKEKSILFTTEDGVEIYDKDEYFIVGSNDNIIPTQSTDNTEYKEGVKRFSTKQAAKEYIENNKPKYSKKDMVAFAKYSKNYVSPRRIDDAFLNWENNIKKKL